MAKNTELDSLFHRQQEAYKKKQEALEQVKAAEEKRNLLKEELDASWEKVSEARESMKQARQQLQSDWQDYKAHMARISEDISNASEQADKYHQEMKSCYASSQDSYSMGLRDAAVFYSQEGRTAKEKRDSWNKRKADLINESRSLAKPGDNLNRHKENFEEQKRSHEEISGRYRQAKEACETVREEYKQQARNFEEAKAAFREAREKDEAMWVQAACVKCGAEIRYRKDWNHVPKYCSACQEKRQKYGRECNGTFDGIAAKIIMDETDGSGRIDIYWGGKGTPDGPGHYHVVTDTASVDCRQEKDRLHIVNRKSGQKNSFQQVQTGSADS